MGETSFVSPPGADTSNIIQCDGNVTITSQLSNYSSVSNDTDNSSENITIVNTDDKVEN